MTRKRPALTIISNAVVVDRIAFSLVHARGRIDVPVRCVMRVDVTEEFSFFDTEGTFWSYPDRSVEICLTCEIRRRLLELTRRIVGEPLDILVGGELIVSPIVREPLGAHNFPFRILVSDLAEARALAARIGGAAAKPDLRMVPT